MLRKLVAEDKYLTTVNGKTFDLTYILPNLVAMGIPATGITSQWRNSRDEIAKYLNTHHPSHYMIWNLTETSYDATGFFDRVRHVGFLDHHPPRFNNLLKIVSDIVSFLKSDTSNVACVHCRAGRGRTGLVCSCVVMALGLYSNATEALEFFAKKRSKISKGSTSPPQIRYSFYFSYILQVLRETQSEGEIEVHTPLVPIPDFKVLLKSVLITGFSPVISLTDFSDYIKPVLYFAPLSQTDPKILLSRFPQVCTKIQKGMYSITFDERQIVNDTIVVVAAATKQSVIVLGKIVMNAFFIDEGKHYLMQIDKMMDPTEGSNLNKYALPPDFSLKFTFRRFDGNEKESVEKHKEIVKKVRETPLDEMENNSPPPLPSKNQQPKVELFNFDELKIEPLQQIVDEKQNEEKNENIESDKCQNGEPKKEPPPIPKRRDSAHESQTPFVDKNFQVENPNTGNQFSFL
ncbi:phosphatase, putative [Entamoeba invadens IP1]|uniref:Phosphatase, putative n=1 Tax=Entamoeba invadens IP1 TaxID=370355 RepID=A0A0A1UC41_ENTIV|nr:phosphatase, putative [Entamoeba invadens IP1]ELP91278.1 phosphatase, putative [Entamoeba invadens IP1]|eukprot:XP_004258049.1 phosphatase, putative [Entamoeba invadens IP1]